MTDGRQGESTITFWYVEEHEPDNGEFPCIVVGHAWTREAAEALLEERRAAVEADRPELDTDDESEACDIFWEIHAGELPIAGCPAAVRQALATASDGGEG